MILLDANVLLAIARAELPAHATAVGWLTAVRAEHEIFGAPHLVWHALTRLMTNHRVLNPPASVDSVVAFADDFRSRAGYRSLEAGPSHLTIFRRMCEASDAHGNLVTDAAIAAIAVENGATVASFDRDFARFPELRWVVPHVV